MRPTYDELQADIKEHQDHIDSIKEAISDTDDGIELAELNRALDFHEGALLVSDEVLMKTIDKGRGD